MTVKLTVLTVLSVVLYVVTAFPNAHIPPGTADNRGPCPGLNTLANHGYLRHDGKNLTSQSILDAALNVYSIENNLIAAVLAGATAIGILVDGVLPLLSDLARHPGNGKNPSRLMEHDMSLTRMDCDIGDCIKQNETLITKLLATNNNGTVITLANVIAAYQAQYEYSKANNPSFYNNVLPAAAAEGGLLIGVFSNDKAYVTGANKTAVESFLKNEQLLSDFQNRKMRFNDTISTSFAVAVVRPLSDALTKILTTAAPTAANPPTTALNDSSTNTPFFFVTLAGLLLLSV